MAPVLRDINAGVAILVGIASGYYIFEPEIRRHELQRRELEEELSTIAKQAREPCCVVREQLADNRSDGRLTRWLLFRK
jgi:hypothetical protein